MLKQLVASYLSSILFLGQPSQPNGMIDVYYPGGLYLHAIVETDSPTGQTGIWLTTIVANVTQAYQVEGLHPHVYIEPINHQHVWYDDPPHRADFNSDGIIDSQDLQMFLSFWGPVDD